MWNMIIFSLFDFNQKGHMVCFCNLLLQHGSGVTQIIESARLIHQQKFHKEQAGYTTSEVVIWILYETIWTCTLKSVHQYLLCFRFFIYCLTLEQSFDLEKLHGLMGVPAQL